MKIYIVMMISIAILLGIISLYSEWLILTFLGEYSITLNGIYSFILENYGKISDLPVKNGESEYTIKIGELVLSIILYPIYIILSILSLKYYRLILPASTTGFLTGISWLIGIESIKNSIINQVKDADPITQMIATALANSISPGIGPYIIIISGIALLIAYTLNKTEKPQDKT